MELRLGADLIHAPHLLRMMAEDAIGGVASARPVEGILATLGPRGWDDPGMAEQHVFVCTGPRCHFRNAPRLRTLLQDEIRRADAFDRCQITETSCLGPCNLGPLVAHYPDGSWYRLETLDDVREFVETVLVGGRISARLRVHRLARRASDAPHLTE